MRHRDRAVGFVDTAGEATSRSEADGLAQEGAKARAGPAGSVQERAGHVARVAVREGGDQLEVWRLSGGLVCRRE